MRRPRRGRWRVVRGGAARPGERPGRFGAGYWPSATRGARGGGRRRQAREWFARGGALVSLSGGGQEERPRLRRATGGRHLRGERARQDAEACCAAHAVSVPASNKPKYRRRPPSPASTEVAVAVRPSPLNARTCLYLRQVPPPKEGNNKERPAHLPFANPIITSFLLTFNNFTSSLFFLFVLRWPRTTQNNSLLLL